MSEGPMMPESYLGDGVYAKFDGFHIILRAESGGQINEIFLEPNVMGALWIFSRNQSLVIVEEAKNPEGGGE